MLPHPRLLRAALLSAVLAGPPARAQSAPPAPVPQAAARVAGAGAGARAASHWRAPSRGRTIRHGAVLGAAAGAGVGALAGLAARCGALKDPIDGDCLSRSSATAIGGAVGGLAGL